LSIPRKEDVTMWVPIFCDCNDKKKGWHAKHWEVCRCACGRMFWAVQPVRSGPFVAAFWPGNAHVGEFENGFPKRRMQ
jgi:hypothetical protein